MTGFLVTVSLLCGCVLNVDAGAVEHAEISPVRIIISGAVLAMRDAQLRIDHATPHWANGTRPLIALLDRAGEQSRTSRSLPNDLSTPSFLLSRAHPVRAPSFA